MLSLTYDLGLNVVMRDFTRLKGGNGSQWSALEPPGVLHHSWEIPTVTLKRLCHQIATWYKFSKKLLITEMRNSGP